MDRTFWSIDIQLFCERENFANVRRSPCSNIKSIIRTRQRLSTFSVHVHVVHTYTVYTCQEYIDIDRNIDIIYSNYFLNI